MKLERVLLLGGSGFIGRHVAAALTRGGTKITVPSRRRERAKPLILLPTVEVIEADVGAPGALERLVRGQDAVINMVGVLHGPSFAKAHVELPTALVAACRASGVKRLVHMSALGAAPDGPSEYLRTKGKGEQVVMEAKDLDVTVFRPSVVYGPEDQFLNRFAMLARLSPVLAVPCPDARFQPVYVGDVARAIATSLGNSASYGQRYDLAGPKEYTLRELVQLVCDCTGRHRLIIGLPDSMSWLQARFLEMLPTPILSRDNLRSMQVANTTRAAFPFGIQPQKLEAACPPYLAPSGPRERLPQLRWRARR